MRLRPGLFGGFWGLAGLNVPPTRSFGGFWDLEGLNVPPTGSFLGWFGHLDENHSFICYFLVACTRLYKPLCRSVGPSVRLSLIARRTRLMAIGLVCIRRSWKIHSCG